MSMKGRNISVLLAGHESTPGNAVATWRPECSPKTAFTHPAVVVPVQTAIDAGMTKVADLGRFAYEQTFGDKPTDMFMKARLVIGSRPHLHQFIWTGQDLCLEALHEEVEENYDAKASALPCSDVQVVFFFEAATIATYWRSTVSKSYDSAIIGGQAVDPRFNDKVFAKMIGSPVLKVNAAIRPIVPELPNIGEPRGASHVVESPDMSLNVVLLRTVQDKVAQLVKTRFVTLRDDIDSVLVPKAKRVASDPPGACPVSPPCFASRCAYAGMFSLRRCCAVAGAGRG